MSYNTKNYRKQGGDEWVVGGKLTIKAGGEVDFEAGSALKFEGEAIEAEQINAALALVGAMVGGYAAAEHDDDTSEDAIEVMAANDNGDGDRAILIIVKCTETLAGTTLPTFQIGDGTTVNKFAKIGKDGNPATFAKDAIAVFAGTLTEESPVEITVTDGTGAKAGAIQVFVIALPASA